MSDEHQSPDNPAKDERYENILRNTLLKRTGRSFKRNVDQAIVPQQEKEKHEDVANRIFDNIIKRKQDRSEAVQSAQASKTPESEAKRPSEISKTYGEILDDLLWTEGGEELNQQTIAENNPLERPREKPLEKPFERRRPMPELDDEPEVANPYQSILRKTLETRSQSFARRRNSGLRVEATDSDHSLSDSPALPGLPSGPSLDEIDAPPLSHHYSAALDEILGFDEDSPAFKQEVNLSRTLYHQKLDEILWPSEDERVQAKELPPVNEAKLRSVVAEYLQQLILAEPYGLIGVQRKVLDEKYAMFWIRETLHQLSQTLQSLETEFTVWIFMQNLELLKKVLTVEFVERYRMMLEQMFPPQKPLSPFNQRKKQESALLERMSSNKFDEVRRLLKTGRDKLSEEDVFHLYHFFKARLPEFLKTHQKTLNEVLRSRSEDAGSNPFVSSFLAAIFFAEPYEQQFARLHENEDRYKQAWQNFLRDKCESLVNKSDPLVPIVLASMELFHERASFFRPAERELLAQGLELLEGLMRFLTEDYFNKEDMLQQFHSMLDTRVQAQFHVEAQVLQSLGQEIGALAYQSDQAARIRANHLNVIYERHTKEISDAYHKRRDTLEKLNAGKGPSWTSRKQFIQRKLKACQQYLQRVPKRQAVAVSIPYREYPAEFLEQRQRELMEAQSWDNDYEKQIMELAFEKANMVLKALNQSKSTVKFNLKVLFNGEPQQDRFLAAFAQIRDRLNTQLAAQPQSETLQYLRAVLHRYLTGLRLPEYSDESFYGSQSAVGYIAAYLAHVSHIKLLVNLQFQQVIYDFHTLFELVHALQMLEMAESQVNLRFEDHYRQSLIPAWFCLLQHCLMIGSGQYHFVANPLALHDYSWTPPISFGLDAFGDDDDEDFTLLAMGDAPEENDMLRFPAVVSEEESTSAKPFRLRGRKASDADLPDDQEPDNTPLDVQNLPAVPGRRRIPAASPGKFEMYSAPTRRQQPVLNPVEGDDDFYKILGQTQASESLLKSDSAPPTSSFTRRRPGILSESTDEAHETSRQLPAEVPPAPSFTRPRSLLSDEDELPPSHFMRPRSLNVEDDLPSTPFTRPRSLSADDEPSAPAVAPARRRPSLRQDTPLKASDDQVSESKDKRKRWLEITPVPQDRQDYDSMLDSILDNWEEPPQPTARRAAKAPGQTSARSPSDDEAQNLVDKILKRNQLNGDMDISGNTSISHTMRRNLDDDY